MDYDKYLQILRDHGCTVARVIMPSDIVTGAWTIMKCRYGCPRYGRNRSCPPFAPSWLEMESIIASYSCAIIFGTPQMDFGTPAALACRRALEADGFYKALAFGTGPCDRCKECKLDNCPHPSEVLPSPEACGIDLVATVRQLGLPITLPPKEGEPLNCYGIILVE